MTPRYSIIIPTLNESRRVERTLAAARAAFGGEAEYIVTDGGSTDGTADIARTAGARVITGRRGRGEQMHRGFEAATGDVCVFVHADTLVPASARDSITAALQDQRVSGGAFGLEFVEKSRRLALLQRAINLRSRTFGSATGDQVIFARRAALHAIDGVPRVPLFEDVRLCRALRRRGKFVILEERVETSARLWQNMGTMRGVLLHLVFRGLHALGASPAFLARHYPAPR
jgi:rSAM/selenodomain-associated transferase 2